MSSIVCVQCVHEIPCGCCCTGAKHDADSLSGVCALFDVRSDAREWLRTMERTDANDGMATGR